MTKGNKRLSDPLSSFSPRISTVSKLQHSLSSLFFGVSRSNSCCVCGWWVLSYRPSSSPLSPSLFFLLLLLGVGIRRLAQSGNYSLPLPFWIMGQGLHTHTQNTPSFFFSLSVSLSLSHSFSSSPAHAHTFTRSLISTPHLNIWVFERGKKSNKKQPIKKAYDQRIGKNV